MAIVAIALAWKFNYRNRCLAASRAIQNAGGSVFYVWEKPEFHIEVRTHVLKPPKGTFPYRMPTVNVPINVFHATANQKPTFQWSNPFDNTDVSIAAAIIPESKVNENLPSILAPLNLKYLMIARDQEHGPTKYARYSSPIREKERIAKLNTFEQSYAVAKRLLTSQLPNVEIVDSTAAPK